MAVEMVLLISSMFVCCVLSWVAVAYLYCVNVELKRLIERMRKHNDQLTEQLKKRSVYFRV